MLKGLMKKAGVKLITPHAEYSFEDEQDDFISDIMAVIAKWERGQIMRRMQRGMEEFVRRGGMWGGGRRVYGYQFDGEKFVPVAEEWVVVKEIFRLARNWGVARIAEYLTEKGIPSPMGKGKWSATTVRMIIYNPVYAGRLAWRKRNKIRYRRNPVTDGMEHWVYSPIPVLNPVVSWEEWISVLKRLAKRSSGRPAKYTYYLRGILKCPVCGKGMCGKGKPKIRMKYYYCPREDYRRHIPARNVEYILPIIFERISKSPETIAKIKEAMVIQLPASPLEELEKRRQALEEARKRAVRLCIMGHITEEELEEELGEINRKIEMIEQEIAVAIQGRELRELYDFFEVLRGLEWDDLTEEQKREFAQFVIESVEINPQTREIQKVSLHPLFKYAENFVFNAEN
jgi:hypothetical protein